LLAASQHLPQDVSSALFAKFRDKFNLLARSLPPRFAPNLVKVRQELPALFSGALPLVLVHSTIGKITGVVDWAETRILPFGFPCGRLRTSSAGWTRQDGITSTTVVHSKISSGKPSQRKLAALQTKVCLSLIRVARVAGLLYRYGLNVDGKHFEGVATQANPSFEYLGVFWPADDSVPITNASSWAHGEGEQQEMLDTWQPVKTGRRSRKPRYNNFIKSAPAKPHRRS